MNHPARHDRVRLNQAVPMLWLERGEVGVVRSVWRSSEFIEVEFHKPGESFGVRALVQAGHLEVIEAAPAAMI